MPDSLPQRATSAPPTLLHALRHVSVAVLALLALLAGPAAAHPHAWIDLAATVEVDGNRLAAIEQTWSIDPVFSRYMIEDARENHGAGDTPESLNGYRDELLGNLGEYGHFIDVRRGDHKFEVALDPQHEPSLAIKDDQLLLHFRLIPNETIELDETLAYRVFDPTFYIEILHGPKRLPTLVGGNGCEASIHPPRPSPELVMRALMMDTMAEPDEDLGRHFAERVDLRCAGTD